MSRNTGVAARRSAPNVNICLDLAFAKVVCFTYKKWTHPKRSYDKLGFNGRGGSGAK